MLANEAKRFPKVAALLERVHTLTDEEIENADVPLKWYKKALRNLRDKMKDKLATQQAFETKMLEVYPYIVDGVVPDPMGEVREWVGGDRWVEMVRNDSLLMFDGKMIWLPVTGGVWIETLFNGYAAPPWINGSRAVGMMTRSQYTEFYKNANAVRLGEKLYSWEEDEKKAASGGGGGGMYRLDGRTDGLSITRQGPTSLG